MLSMSRMNKGSLAVALLSAGLATFFAGGATQAIGLGFVGVGLSVLGACILLATRPQPSDAPSLWSHVPAPWGIP